MTLIQWLIQQINTESYRAGRLSGEKHPRVDQQLIDAVGGRERLLAQAREIEKDRILRGTGRIRFRWRDMGADIQSIDYSVDIMPELCRREGVEDPRKRQLRYLEILNCWKDKVKDTWLVAYYDEEIHKLEKGKCSLSLQEDLEDGFLYQCLDTIIHLEEPVEKRIFSAKLFGSKTSGNATPSKMFERYYESKALSVLRRSPEYFEGMSNDELLAAHGILSYTQTLEWKGALIYQLEASETTSSNLLDHDDKKQSNLLTIETSQNRYGTIIGAQTLERALPQALPGVKRVMVIENKANYERMNFREDTLYLFCHGFFSPKEVRFLKKLCESAEEGTQYYHWGDLDYGGIRIFLYNQKNIFPELKPYKMDRPSYEQAAASGAGVAISDAKREKLEKLDAGVLEELKRCILEYGMEIEQELLV